MTVNDINQSLISAIELLAQKCDNELNTTLTIEGTIIGTLDSEIGAYSVNYMGSVFTAYANNPNIAYTIDDKVYVIVPNGDFTKEKFILGYPTTVTEDEAENPTLEVGGDFLDLPTNVSFCTYDKENFDKENPLDNSKMSKKRRVYSLPLTNKDFYKKVIQDYFNNYGSFKFSCKVKTNIVPESDSTSRQVDGNYGIILKIKYWPYEQLDRNRDTLITKEVVIDNSNILGNPYDQMVFSTQNVVIDDIPKGATIAVEEDDCIELSYFVEGFSQNLPAEDDFLKDAEGTIIDLADDLFIKDIQLKALSVIPKEKLSGYSLQIASSMGNFLTKDSSTYFYTDGITTKTISAEEYKALPAEEKALYASRLQLTTLSPIIKRKGKEVMLSDAPCYWFIEDSSVTSTADKRYSSFGGLGWRVLNPFKDEELGLYKTNHYSLDVGLLNLTKDYYDKVDSTSVYKCVILYDQTLIKDEITIKNMDSNLDIAVESVTGSNKVIAGAGTAHLRCVIKNASEDNYTYNWARYNKNGEFIESLKPISGIPNEVKIPAIYIDTMNIVKCTVYRDNTCLGSSSINIVLDTSVDYIVTIKNSDILYKYDSDGDSPMSPKYDGSVGSAITSISPLKINIYRADGVELIEEEYKRVNVTWSLPVYSLMKFDESVTSSIDSNQTHYIYKTNGWSSHSIGINYSIESTYKNDAMDNTVTVTIDFDGSQVTQSSTILFLKDGEDGTNGTSYTAAITYLGLSNKSVANDGTPHRFQVYTDGSKFRYINYRAFNQNNTGLFDFYDEEKASTDTELVRKSNRILLNDPNGFDVAIYYNGRDITQDEGVSYEITRWSIVNYLTPTSGTLVSVERDSLGDDKYYFLKLNSENYNGQNNCAILQAQIKLKNSREYIYAYYPIEIIKLPYFSQNPLRYYFLDGFTSVMYAADGSSPKYSNGKYFSFYSNNGVSSTPIDLDLKREDIVSVSGTLRVNKRPVSIENEQKYYIYNAIPKTEYNGETNNFIKYTLGEIDYYIPIYCYYDTTGYSNMIKWDGSTISVDGDAKIVSSQVLSGVSGNSGFTGLTIGVTETNDNIDKKTKNGLISFQNGNQTSYISADTGAVYLGPHNEISFAVPSANSVDDGLVTNTICGWTATVDRLYDKFGENNITALYSEDAKHIATYKAEKDKDSSSHLISIKAEGPTHKTLVSYDGTFYTDGGNIGGWIITPNGLVSKDGKIVLDSTLGAVTGGAADVSDAINDLITKYNSLVNRIEILETDTPNPGEGENPSSPAPESMGTINFSDIDKLFN